LELKKRSISTVTAIFVLFLGLPLCAQNDSDEINQEVEKVKTLPRAKSKKKSSSKSGKKKVPAQMAVVSTDGAAIYEHADFDSRPLTFLEQGRKIIIARQPTAGRGGIGSFYKTRVGKGLGYISDVDVVTKFKQAPSSNRLEANPAFDGVGEDEDEEDNPNEAQYFRRWIGGSLGLMGFAEKFSGKESSAQSFGFGIKLTGPDILVGIPLDYNLYMSWGLPKYYNEIKAKGGTGFFMIGDIVLPMPVADWGKSGFTIGLGPMFSYSRFGFKVRNSTFDSQEIGLGAAFMGSFHFVLGPKWIVRIEPKYYWEKTKYLSYFGVLQHTF
jgi:hypothetical protein